MTPPEQSLHKPPFGTAAFRPTDEQRARAAATRRFTRLFIYLPVGAGTAVVAGLTLYLLYLAIFPPTEDTRLFLSGLADFILILCLLPTVLIGGLLLTAGIGGALYYRYGLDESQRPLSPAPADGRVRTWLWRIDSLLARFMRQLNAALTRAVQPVIRFNAWFAYVESWLNTLKKLMTREGNGRKRGRH